MSVKKSLEIDLDQENLLEETEASNLTTIENLPEECLIKIFQYLSLAERARIERVSKTLRDAAKQSWYNVKELKFDHKFLGLKPYPESKIDVFTLREILERCGFYLTKIDLLEYYDCYYDCLPMVAEYCPNIQIIKFNEPSNIGLKRLSKKCKNIYELTIRAYDTYYENELADLFSVNKNLKLLEISTHFAEIAQIGKCLLKLPLQEMLSIKLDVPFISNLSYLINNAKNLNVFEVEIDFASTITDLANSCSNLTSLNLSCNSENIENVDFLFSQVFIKNKNLKSLSLSSFSSLTGECLVSLNKNCIEEINLYSNYNIQGRYLIESLPHFEKLHTVARFSLDSDDVAECLSLCSNLKDVFCSYEGLLPENLKKSFSSSKNIESLCISGINRDSPTEKPIYIISSTLLQLKDLFLSECEGITDKDLESLCNLPNLEELALDVVSNITGSGIVKLSNLKKLSCERCPELEDDPLISLMECALNLELLVVWVCNKITPSVVHAANEITKKRTNHVALEIRIQKRVIDFKGIKDKSPLINLYHRRW